MIRRGEGLCLVFGRKKKGKKGQDVFFFLVGLVYHHDQKGGVGYFV